VTQKKRIQGHGEGGEELPRIQQKKRIPGHGEGGEEWPRIQVRPPDPDVMKFGKNSSRLEIALCHPAPLATWQNLKSCPIGGTICQTVTRLP